MAVLNRAKAFDIKVEKCKMQTVNLISKIWE